MSLSVRRLSFQKKMELNIFIVHTISKLVQFTRLASTNIPSKRELLKMSAKFLALYCAFILDLLWYCLPCLSKNWYFEVGETCLCGPSVWQFCFIAIYAFVLQILEHCSPLWGSAAGTHVRVCCWPSCEGLLLALMWGSAAGTHVGVCCWHSCEGLPDTSDRCIRWPGFALTRLSCRCIIDVMLLHCVCCTRLIRTLIIVYSVSFHLHLS